MCCHVMASFYFFHHVCFLVRFTVLMPLTKPYISFLMHMLKIKFFAHRQTEYSIFFVQKGNTLLHCYTAHHPTLEEKDKGKHIAKASLQKKKNRTKTVSVFFGTCQTICAREYVCVWRTKHKDDLWMCFVGSAEKTGIN